MTSLAQTYYKQCHEKVVKNIGQFSEIAHELLCDISSNMACRLMHMKGIHQFGTNQQRDSYRYMRG